MIINGKKTIQFIFSITFAVFLFMLATFGFAKEKIIQHEKLSFDKCLKVIDVSQDALSVVPDITDVSVEKRLQSLS